MNQWVLVFQANMGSIKASKAELPPWSASLSGGLQTNPGAERAGVGVMGGVTYVPVGWGQSWFLSFTHQHNCYFLKKSHTINQDGFKYCWKHYLISETILTDFQPKLVYDCNNQIIKTPAGNKNFMILEKILNNTKTLDQEERISKIKHEIDTEFTGDNKYQAYKKNFVTWKS